jgi:hypothetical protein
MLVAPDELDQADPAVPRIADPELRSRLVGYLSCAAQARPGYRTDGVWAWPESLADRLRANGFGPGPQLVDHIMARRALIPTSVSEADMETAAASVAAPPGASGRAAYLVARSAGSDSPSDLVCATAPATVGTAVAGGAWLTATGWRMADDPPDGVARREVPLLEVTAAEAARTADELTRGWHAELWEHGRESAAGNGPRPARVFDTALAGDRPAFSPNRARIVERERRERAVRYLMQGRVVLRTTGRMPDLSTDDPTPRVPLSFRTDGVWVWSEAVAFYLSIHGIAPELEFLCHLEERAYIAPPTVGDSVARAAAVVAQWPPTAITQAAPSYFRSAGDDLFRRWRVDGRLELLEADLRWRRCPPDWSLPWRDLVEITEADAGREIDARWSRDAD